jgi:hypothetical protein
LQLDLLRRICAYACFSGKEGIKWGGNQEASQIGKLWKDGVKNSLKQGGHNRASKAYQQQF